MEDATEGHSMGSMGSTDKTMVALVALEQVKRGEASLEDEVTVTAQDREIELLSTDEPLFTHLPATGVKTGTTPGAGSSLVATAAAEDEAYFSVILEAREDRSAASIWALEHGFAAYDRPEIVAGGEKYAEADVPYRRGERMGLVARESVEGLVDGDPEAGREVRVFEDLPGSAHPDTTLGEGRPRSSPARATTRPRCGSGCGIQSRGFLRRRGRGQRRLGR
jgi:serine-type D-Ala-D-Ala carboxypeptidase (penicillin-binding protein 5/6)